MPFRSLSTLQSWINEFDRNHIPTSGTLKVLQQDGDEGANTGLVAYRFNSAPTLAYIQPDAAQAVEWVVTMEPSDRSVTLSSNAVRELAGELSMLSELCGFLQSKSRAYIGSDTA